MGRKRIFPDSQFPLQEPNGKGSVEGRPSLPPGGRDTDLVLGPRLKSSVVQSHLFSSPPRSAAPE